MTLSETKDLAMSQGATLFQDMGYGGYIVAYRPAQSTDFTGTLGEINDEDEEGNDIENRRKWARAILRPNQHGYTLGDWAFCAPPEGV